MTTKTFTVPNISCNHCVHTVKTELGDLAGVQSVTANAETKQVTVDWDSPADWAKIEALLKEINYAPA
ncbi:MAG: heavy-metal-associated domain-containing protein [Caldilineaceae bacterium]|nr:heavy-metal-associated domain-containing protein [Caldilineaceae bacterium]HRJ42095.1 heavy-metal-associated domain-containing protein [Caldilineaceae bacterium]